MGQTILEGVEIKSGGEIVDTIDISQFTDIATAVEFFNDAEAETPVDGEEECLKLINQQYKANEMNAARAAKTRSVSPMNRLRDVIKSNPDAAAKLNALLAELDIGSVPVGDVPAAEAV